MYCTYDKEVLIDCLKLWVLIISFRWLVRISFKVR